MQVTGIDLMIENLKRYSEDQKYRLKLALDSVLIEIVNWVKQNHQSLGGWVDRTGNLNNSISYQPSEWVDDILKGSVFAGMGYGVYVEFKEGHWVISGGMSEYRDKIMNIIVERCRV
jgi:hypothetical protein